MNDKDRLEHTEQFLEELARFLPENERVMAGYAPEATVQTDEFGKKLNAGWWPVPWKSGKWINTRGNCYVCISSSIPTPHPKNGKMRYWRGEASFGHGLALMIDDIGTGKGSKGEMSVADIISTLKPTAIVETSPNNYQIWYFLDKPEESLKKFKAFIVGFVNHVLKKGGDNTIKDVSRYGRMPCGINNKRIDGNGGPFKYVDSAGKVFGPRLVYWKRGNRYPMQEIAAAFGYEIVIPTPRRVEVDRDDVTADYLWLALAEEICSAAGMGEGAGGAVSQNMSGKYRIMCPWGNEHANGDPFGAYFRGPIPGADVEFVFGCGHDTCRKERKRTWTTFIDYVVMPRIDADLEEANTYWLDKS